MMRCVIGKWFARCLATGLLLAVMTPPVSAQDPTRNGNIWDGFNHQPTPGEINALEQADGIKPDQAEQQRELDEIYALDRTLLGKDDNLPDHPPRTAAARHDDNAAPLSPPRPSGHLRNPRRGKTTKRKR